MWCVLSFGFQGVQVGFDYDGFYFGDCIVLVGKDCMCDNGVVDVQLSDFGNGGDGLDVGVMQFVVGIDFQVEFDVSLYGDVDVFQLFLLFMFVGGIGIMVCMKFDDRGV